MYIAWMACLVPDRGKIYTERRYTLCLYTTSAPTTHDRTDSISLGKILVDNAAYCYFVCLAVD